MFALIWFHGIGSFSCTDLLLKTGHLGKRVSVHGGYLSILLMEFGVHLKGKETHLFCPQRIEDFENPVSML